MNNPSGCPSTPNPAEMASRIMDTIIRSVGMRKENARPASDTVQPASHPFRRDHQSRLLPPSAATVADCQVFKQSLGTAAVGSQARGMPYSVAGLPGSIDVGHEFGSFSDA